MASENETFDEVLRCIQNDIVHFVGKPVKHSRDLLQEYHDRFKAAHRREVAELERKVAELRECLKETMVDAVAEYKNNSCFRNVKCGEIERCRTCKITRWRKALKGASND